MEISFLYFERDNSVGEFYSIAVTNNHQYADTGTKMIHIGKTPNLPLFLKEFRQENLIILIVVWLKVMPSAKGARNFHNVILF